MLFILQLGDKSTLKLWLSTYQNTVFLAFYLKEKLMEIRDQGHRDSQCFVEFYTHFPTQHLYIPYLYYKTVKVMVAIV